MESNMLKRTIPALLTLAVFLTACGPEAPPTMSAEEVQGTAVSAAWTVVAMTQQAIPTNTPVPPTETPSPTPLPTFTPLVPPTSEIPTLDPFAAAPTSTTSGDPCNKPLPGDPDGKSTTLRLDNEAGAPVTLSIYLYKTPFGECGYRGYTLSPGAKTKVSFPQGCYSFYAWINNPKAPSNASGGGPGVCANNPDLWVVSVGKEVIKLLPP